MKNLMNATSKELWIKLRGLLESIPQVALAKTRPHAYPVLRAYITERIRFEVPELVPLLSFIPSIEAHEKNGRYICGFNIEVIKRALLEPRFWSEAQDWKLAHGVYTIISGKPS